jgi:hypothetical protein
VTKVYEQIKMTKIHIETLCFYVQPILHPLKLFNFLNNLKNEAKPKKHQYLGQTLSYGFHFA